MEPQTIILICNHPRTEGRRSFSDLLGSLEIFCGLPGPIDQGCTRWATCAQLTGPRPKQAIFKKTASNPQTIHVKLYLADRKRVPRLQTRLSFHRQARPVEDAALAEAGVSLANLLFSSSYSKVQVSFSGAEDQAVSDKACFVHPGRILGGFVERKRG